MIYKDAVAGSTVILFLDIEDAEDPTLEPVTGQSPTVAIRRQSDDKWYDFVAGVWDTFATYVLLQASNKQALTDKGDGAYEYDWNQQTADPGAEREYAMVYQIASGDYQAIRREVWTFRADVARDDQWTDARAALVGQLDGATDGTLCEIIKTCLTELSNRTFNSSLHDLLGIPDTLNHTAITDIQNGLALESTLTAIKGAGWTTETLLALSDALDIAAADVAGLDGAIMRGTDGAALAGVWTPAVAARIERALGLGQENQYIDTVVADANDRMISARLRIYSVAGSVGTDADVVATYTITVTYTGDATSPTTYKVVKET